MGLLSSRHSNTDGLADGSRCALADVAACHLLPAWGVKMKPTPLSSELQAASWSGLYNSLIALVLATT